MNDLSPVHQQRRDDLLAPATQIVRSRADYLGEDQGDVGQRVADDKLELFVTLEPAQAMLQQFAQFAPDFIALHDVGASQSLRLLNAIASALNTKVQQLAIRKQGHGVALATLPFVELPGRGSQHLRVYSTDIDTDSHSRKALSNVLLGHSRLGVLMVGDMPAHLLTQSIQPLRDAIIKGPWPNRELLLVPMGSPAALASQASALVGPPGLVARVTPKASAPNDAWNYITGAWNRLRESGTAKDGGPAAGASSQTAGASRSGLAGATAGEVAGAGAGVGATAPKPVSSLAELPTEAMPLPGQELVAAPEPPSRWNEYLHACQAIKGLVSACVFDFRTVKALAHTGARPEPERLMAQGMQMFSALAESSRALGLGHAQPDAAISLTGHHLLLHPLPGHPGIILHAVLDASVANLTLARMQLQRVDTSVLAAPPKPPGA